MSEHNPYLCYSLLVRTPFNPKKLCLKSKHMLTHVMAEEKNATENSNNVLYLFK